MLIPISKTATIDKTLFYVIKTFSQNNLPINFGHIRASRIELAFDSEKGSILSKYCFFPNFKNNAYHLGLIQCILLTGIFPIMNILWVDFRWIFGVSHIF
jgi:hypothetical protein